MWNIIFNEDFYDLNIVFQDTKEDDSESKESFKNINLAEISNSSQLKSPFSPPPTLASMPQLPSSSPQLTSSISTTQLKTYPSSSQLSTAWSMPYLWQRSAIFSMNFNNLTSPFLATG